jgi:hypothetical protein
MIHDQFPYHESQLLDLIDDPLAQLKRLDRYERRAVSRRDRALRAIMTADAGDELSRRTSSLRLLQSRIANAI